MRGNRIGFKLGAVIITVFLVVILFLAFAIDRMFTNFYTAEMRRETEDLTSHFALMANTTDTTSEQMMTTFAEFSNVSIFNVLKDGEVILHSGVHDSEDSSFIHATDLSRIFAGNRVSLLHEDPSGNRYFVSGQPITQGGSITSALFVMSSTEQMEQSLSAVRKLLLLSGMGAFLFALGITWIVAQVLSRPLLQMQKATRKIAVGELETRLDIRSKDEIGSLAEAINDLAVDLQRYRDTRQELFSNISHELRTPITYLEGYSKVVKDELYETEEEKNLYLDIIFQEAVRLQHLVDDVFDLAKMEEGQIVLDLQWLDLSELLEQAVSKVRLKARDKGLELSVSYSGHTVPVHADGKRMEQIILNLLENGLRYTERGGVEVQLLYQADRVTLVVEDTGMGIPEEELPYIFERFYRVEKSRSREFGGTGLGLSIVKKLIELQDGKITVISKAGTGSRFEIQLPLRPERGEAHHEKK
ncbi:two-component sensor histidine kinase [Bacillus sp. FJAT-27264]|uniref:sensor histidine kinase n=1 Tax=Paenibacillus sp. (strain DSM 101736 / FJAT-27264) TaxID=1850362 RepID=UPI000807F250|nr:HAMP domain-containing sensor histidine kinase [Bacillus sp. FJAT-27264]OBZ09585.1 two-component sensor histidine kinase [Bacillus sp. FJAT-27264]